MTDFKPSFGNPCKVEPCEIDSIRAFGHQNGILRLVINTGEAYDYFDVVDNISLLLSDFRQGKSDAYNNICNNHAPPTLAVERYNFD